MEIPKVSVIIPVYNGEKYLNLCLDSVINQTLKDIEIICVNDGSTDSSYKILCDYAMKDRRVRVITQSNINAGAARNNGMLYASGEYYSFLDADDFFETDMLEKAYNKAVEEELDIVIFHSDAYYQEKGEYIFDENTIKEKFLKCDRPFSGRNFKNNLFCTFVGWTWDKLFRGEFVRKSGVKFQEQRTANDLKFVYTMLAIAERIDVIDDILVHQRKTEGSLSATRERSWDCCYFGLLALREELKLKNVFERYERDFINYTINYLFWNLHTLAWPEKEVVFNKLKYEWFKELGAADKSKEYFYDPYEFEVLNKLLEGRYGDMFDDSAIEENKRLKEENALLKEQLKKKRGLFGR